MIHKCKVTSRSLSLTDRIELETLNAQISNLTTENPSLLLPYRVSSETPASHSVQCVLLGTIKDKETEQSLGCVMLLMS